MTNEIVSPAVPSLLRKARMSLADAAGDSAPRARYVAAHFAALRAVAAVVAAKGVPSPRRRRSMRNVWEQLAELEPRLAEAGPDLAQWAAYFAGCAPKRAATEAGLPSGASAKEADRHLQCAEQFLSIVERALGVAASPSPPLRAVNLSDVVEAGTFSASFHPFLFVQHFG